MSENPALPTVTQMQHELSALTTERVDSGLRDLDTFSTERMLRVMNTLDHEVPDAVEQAIPVITAAVDDIVGRLSEGGRLIYIGAGTPGRLGVLDASECPPTFNTDPGMVHGVIAGGDGAIRTSVEGAEDDADAGAADLAGLALTELDTVTGISASGRTPYVLGALQYARSIGALTISIACNSGSAIGAVADHAIDIVVGPELIAGSTRLRAGTAQKLVLNMLSTATMVRLGKTYGNVMVDLRASNQKLRARSRRAVTLITGASESDAARALEATGGSAKEAALVLMRGLSPQEAHSRLTRTPSLRQVLRDTLPR